MHGRSFFFAVLKNVASEKFKFSLSFQTQFATKKKNWSSPNVVYFEVEWLSKSTIYSVVWLVRKFSGVALCYKSNSICLSQKVCWFFLRDDFFWHFLAKNGKNGIKTQVAIDKNVIKMKLKHKWFILAQDKGPQGYVCSYEHTRRTTKNFPLPCIGVSMYTTRFVYKNGGTPNEKSCGAPTRSKKIRTSPSSLLFLKSDIHLPIISNEKRGSCFLRLHSSNSKEQGNLVHSYCENLQRTIQVFKNFP